jgi:DNA-binding response OmpR family regulator
MSYILVAEDDNDIQLLVRRKLEGAGYTVRATAYGDEAIQLACGERPLLLLLDVLLPRVSGLDVCRYVKGYYETTPPPVIIISANGQQADVDAGLEAGADDYVIKPLVLRELVQKVQNAIQNS